MENLNKENFWNRLQKQYPDAVNLFCRWIDEYKAANGWDTFFKQGVKFHDIPFELQNGILARFDIECNNGIQSGRGSAVYESQMPVYKQQTHSLFSDLQNQLNKQKQ